MDKPVTTNINILVPSILFEHPVFAQDAPLSCRRMYIGQGFAWKLPGKSVTIAAADV